MSPSGASLALAADLRFCHHDHVGFFSRTAPEVKTARQAWSRGDLLFQCGMRMSADVDPNVLLNQIAGVGWAMHSFVVVFEDGVPYAVYVFARPRPAVADTAAA